MQPLCGPFSFRLFLPTLLSGVATGQLAFRPAHGHIDVYDRRMLKDHVAGSHPLSNTRGISVDVDALDDSAVPSVADHPVPAVPGPLLIHNSEIDLQPASGARWDLGWNLVFGQEPIPADPPDLSTLSSRWWVSSSHNSDTGPHWEATFQHVMDPQTLDGHYIAGPQTGDDASPQSGKGVPFVLGQPAVCEQPEPCSKAAGLGQFPGKLGCPQIAFASRQTPPTTFRSAPGAPGRDKLVHNPLPGLPAASAGLGAGSVYREGLIGAAWSSLWIKRMYNGHEIKGTGRKRGPYFKSTHKST